MGFELLRYGYASAMMLLGFLGCLALGVAQYPSSAAGGWASRTKKFAGSARPCIGDAA